MTGKTTFTQEVADNICQRLAMGESLRSICDDESMPSMSTVFKWLADVKPFSEQYARAREAQADALADDILSIADDARNDWMENNADGNMGWKENGEALRRSQLRIDARKWLAGKMKPKKYGEKLDLNHSGAIDITEEAATAKLAALLKEIGMDSDTGNAVHSEEAEQA